MVHDQVRRKDLLGPGGRIKLLPSISAVLIGSYSPLDLSITTTANELHLIQAQVQPHQKEISDSCGNLFAPDRNLVITANNNLRAIERLP
jgi:hypothetical protein